MPEAPLVRRLHVAVGGDPATLAAKPILHQQFLRSALHRQESGSMVPALLLEPTAHHAVLDMCAAPGSKSIQLLEMMTADAADAAAAAATDITNDVDADAADAAAASSATAATASIDTNTMVPGAAASGKRAPAARPDRPGGHGLHASGVLVANDASLSRVISLTHRLTSVNVAAPQCVITSLDARYWPDTLLRGGSTAGGQPFRFDRILCDVPCSGDGTLRKRHANTPEWSESAAAGLHSTQCRLLRTGLLQLAPGGTLVYSTCALNPIENEAVVASVLRSLHSAGAASDPTASASAASDPTDAPYIEFEVIDPRLTHAHLFRSDGTSATPGDGPRATPGDEPSATPADEPSAMPGDEPSAMPAAQPGAEGMARSEGGLYAAPGLTSWSVPTDSAAAMRPPAEGTRRPG